MPYCSYCGAQTRAVSECCEEPVTETPPDWVKHWQHFWGQDYAGYFIEVAQKRNMPHFTVWMGHHPVRDENGNVTGKWERDNAID